VTATLQLLALPEDADSPAPLGASIRVVLADDHAMVRRTLRLMLDVEQDIDVIAEAVDLAAMMSHVRQHMPRVLVLDLRLPNGMSTETIRQLRKEFPETEVVVLTVEESPLFAQKAIEAGAIGFVVNDRVDAELLGAVRRAGRGEAYISPRVASELEGIDRAINEDGLRPRETEVLRAIALGYTSAEIADKLHLSRRTIETHRANVHRKLGLATRAELVQFALRRHLIGA
jgi:two-component system, NarL family, response regulator NreC